MLLVASAAGAVLIYTYLDVGALGPLPKHVRADGDLPGKRGSALAETAATLSALTGLALAVAGRRAPPGAAAVTSAPPVRSQP